MHPFQGNWKQTHSESPSLSRPLDQVPYSRRKKKKTDRPEALWEAPKNWGALLWPFLKAKATGNPSLEGRPSLNHLFKPSFEWHAALFLKCRLCRAPGSDCTLHATSESGPGQLTNKMAHASPQWDRRKRGSLVYVPLNITPGTK